MDYYGIQVDEFKTSGKDGRFSGYASIFGNTDLGGDIITQGAFKQIVKGRNGMVKVLNQHNPWDPIGNATVEQDSKGLAFDGQLVLDAPSAKAAYALMKAGALDGMSIGYDVLPGGSQQLATGERQLNALKLWEISPVTWGMNPEAGIDSVKFWLPESKAASASTDWPIFSGRERAFIDTEAEARVRKWASRDGSGDKDQINWDKFASVHFWRDPKNKTSFSGYKMKFCDVINGKLYAVWHGITVAAAEMQGARGGVDIPQEDVDGVRRKIEIYYAKAREAFNDDTIEAPWKQGKGVLVADALGNITNIREFEKFLRESGSFSKSQATAIAAGGWSALQTRREAGKADDVKDYLEFLDKFTKEQTA